VTNSVLRAADYLTRNGHQVLIIASGEGPSEVNGVAVRRVPALALQSFAQIDIPGISRSSIVKIIREFAPDIVHLASPFLLGEQVRKAAITCSVPVVANFQTDVSGFINFYGLTTAKSFVERRIRRIHNGSTITLAPSSDTERYLREIGIKGIHRWGRGVDLKQFNPGWRSNSLRRSWGADSETCVIGFVGRLAPEKQVHKLAFLKDVGVLTGKKVKFVIVGDGPSRSALEKSFSTALFLGHLSGHALSKAMASMDLLVTTGENETFCQVIQEAMAAGLPVIAPEIGGPRDLINPEVTGLFYTPGEELDIRKRVLTLVNFPEKREQMSLAAFNSVQDRTWDSVCADLVEIYENVLNAQVRSGRAS
jgi:phosphatidylinositol alpha 1,6-mannosyltransferase